MKYVKSIILESYMQWGDDIILDYMTLIMSTAQLFQWTAKHVALKMQPNSIFYILHNVK